MNIGVLLRAGVAGLIAGLICSAIWAAIGYYTGYRISIFILGMGVLVGLAVVKVARHDAGMQTGFLAVMIVLSSVIAGKSAMAYMLLQNAVEEAAHEQWDGAPSDGSMISIVAAYIVDEYMETGQEIVWPEDVGTDGTSLDVYPLDIQTEALARWKAMSDEQRQALREEWTFSPDMLSAHLVFHNFYPKFATMEWVFVALGAVAAFKIGGGLGSD